MFIVTFWLFCWLVTQCKAVLTDSLVGMYTARWALALAACAPHGSRQVWREEWTHVFLCQALMWPRWGDPHVMIYDDTVYMYILDTVWVRQDTICHGFARKISVISITIHPPAFLLHATESWNFNAFYIIYNSFCPPTGVLVFFQLIYIPPSFPNSSQTPMYFAPAVCFPWSRCGISAALSCLGMCWCCTWSRWGEGERSTVETDPAKECGRCSRTQ